MVKFGNLTDRFRDGIQAFFDGKKVRDNPYQPRSEEWEDWKDGHAFAKACEYVDIKRKEADKIVKS